MATCDKNPAPEIISMQEAVSEKRPVESDQLIKTSSSGADASKGEEEGAAGEGKGGNDLMALLQASIANLNSKFDKFNDTVTQKITVIEKNYETLNAKIDSLKSADWSDSSYISLVNRKPDWQTEREKSRENPIL